MFPQNYNKLIMFANFFKNLIVSQFGSYIEDFTSDDIVVDKWNGQVVKDNVSIKKTALESICMSLFGAPVQVSKGYIKKMRIDIPWNKLLSKPCEINLDEIHIIVKSNPSYDINFARRMIWKAKQGKFQELLESIRKQKGSLFDGDQPQEKDTYINKLNNIISENLRLVISNVHIRFEDSFVSRRDTQFNFGIMFDNLYYSVTNNNFERVFINIDDKKQEQRSFSMLEIKQAALYWNSNSQENWSQSKDFLNLPVQRLIEYSKKYTDQLKKRYHQYQQGLTTNNVFLIQPCDIRFRFRKNLAPMSITEIPRSTTALDISGISLTIDEEMYKDVQYLMKFFSWHSKAVQGYQHFKFRPAYNLPIKGNAHAYWDYAIKSTLYQIKKQKQDERYLRQKRQIEMIELSQLYMMKIVNENYERTNQTTRMLTSGYTDPNGEDLPIRFDSEMALNHRIKKLEVKLTPEQMVVAHMKAEKPASDFIKQQIENASWRSWIPGMFKGIAAKGESTNASFQSIPESEQDFETILAEYSGFSEEQDLNLEEENKSEVSFSQQSSMDYKVPQILKNRIHSHFSLSIPKSDISFVSKRQGSYSKYFMLISVEEIFYQNIGNLKEKHYLFFVRNLELIDKLAEKQKFSKALMKKDFGPLEQPIQKQGSDVKKQKPSQMKGYLSSHYDKIEIEEEASTNANNGLPFIKAYNQILESSKHLQQAPFFLFQLQSKTIVKKNETCHQYQIEVFLNSLQIFYNRVLISRAQTFINQATINRVQNAAAEADFDSKMQRLKNKAEAEVNKILDRSEIQLCCNIKGIEILIPDNTNYEAAKFIMLYTGNIIAKNGSSGNQAFTMRKQLKDFIQEHHNDYQLKFEVQDEYSFTVYDMQVFYIPSLSHLENLQYLESHSPEFSRYSILKKTDLITDIQLNSDANIVTASISNIEIHITNKEVKEIKNFIDNLQKYQQQIALEVQRELHHIQLLNYSINQFEKDYNRIAAQVEEQDDEEEKSFFEEQDKVLALVPNEKPISLSKSVSLTSKILKRRSSNLDSQSSSNDDKYESANGDMFSAHGSKESANFRKERTLSRGSLEEEDDEFFDALDVFDKDVIQMLKLDENYQKIQETEHAHHHHFHHSNISKKLIFEFVVKKIQINLQEAVNINQDLVQGLRQRLGSFGTEQIDLDIKFKGIQFLQLELSQIGAMFINYQEDHLIAFGLREISLSNFEKPSIPEYVFRSTNCENDYFFGRVSPSNSPVNLKNTKSQIFDIENEDMIEAEAACEDVSEYFIKLVLRKSNSQLEFKDQINSRIGMVEFDINDLLLQKIMDTLVIDFPVIQGQQQIKVEENLKQKTVKDISISWDGIISKLKCKKDVSSIRISKISIQTTQNSSSSQISINIDDFRVSQNENELILKIKDEFDDTEPIFTIKIQENSENQSTDITIDKLLFISDVNQLNQLFQNILRVKKIVYIKSQPNQIIMIDKQEAQIKSNQIVNVGLRNSFIQVPVKDSKNSLFLMIDDLTYSKQLESQNCKLQNFQVFVARSIDQFTKYNLINIQSVSLTINRGFALVDIGTIYLSLNENYILLAANIVDEHFENSVAIITKFQSLSEEIQEPIEKEQQIVLTQQEVDSFLKMIPICQPVEKAKPALESIYQILSIKCRLIGVQWIFGQGFDDHEDNFVTLFNKNFSQQILSQFDQKQPDLEFIDTSTKRKGHDFLNIGSMENNEVQNQKGETYETLKFEIEDFRINQLNHLELNVPQKLLVVQAKLISLNLIETNLNETSIFSFSYTKDNQAINDAVEFTKDSDDFFELSIIFFELSLNNRNAKVISTLTKSIYSCKNILKRGKKRELFKKIMNNDKQTIKVQKHPNFDFEIMKWKVFVFNVEIPQNINENEGDKTQNIFIQKITSSLSADVDHKHNSTSQLVLEGNIKVYHNDSRNDDELRNQDPLLQTEQRQISIERLTLYFEPRASDDILQSDFFLSDVVVLIHPFDLSVEIKRFFNLKGEKTKYHEILIPIVEAEISLKQIFHVRTLVDKIAEEFQPLVQLAKHFTKNESSKHRKRKDIQETEKIKSYESSKLKINLYAFYFTLVKESGEVFYKNESLCLPLFSLELKPSTFKLNFSEDKPKTLDCTIPLELYYFNNKLNFYEPLIERAYLNLHYSKDEKKNQVFNVDMVKVLNINFSVSLYETVFNFSNTLQNEEDIYTRNKQLKIKKSGEADDRSSNQHRQKVNRDINFNPSMYYIKNSTGEFLMFKTAKQPAFTELQAEEMQELDFEMTQDKYNSESSRGNREQHVNSDDDVDNDEIEVNINDSQQINRIYDFKKEIKRVTKPVSKYRRENLRYLRGQPKKVFLQILIGNDKNPDRSSVFEVNLDSLTCQRVYLDDQRLLYVICQSQTKNGVKHLIVRSPMQITNNLQIPVEIQLIQRSHKLLKHSIYENSSLLEPDQEEMKVFEDPTESRATLIRHEMIIKPEQSMIIPLKACSFESVKMRPLMQLQQSRDLFEWTDTVDMCLLQDDREIFERKPQVMVSKIARGGIDPMQRNNNRLFFMLNANVYSIRSFIDFNTQQTEFISVKYLQISPPFTIQNLLPVTMSLLIKNVERDLPQEMQPASFRKQKDRQLYKLEMKMNSSIQSLFLNPLGNFDLSLCIPGYDISSFVPLKKEGDEDYEMSQENEQSNYINNMFDNDERPINQSEVAGDLHPQTQLPKNKFRFLRQKKMLIQMTSRYQNQLNVCANFAFIQGYYHISLFAKYWFLNNTQMPLYIQMKTDSFAFDEQDLPFESKDYDFESINKYTKNDPDYSTSHNKKGEHFDRKQSIDSYQTETFKESKSQYKSATSQSHIKDGENEINYKEIINHLSQSENYMFGHRRLKPWESYKTYQNQNAGLLAALTEEEINQISTIYMAEKIQNEQFGEEEKVPQEQEKSIKDAGKKSVRFFEQQESFTASKLTMMRQIGEEETKGEHLMKSLDVPKFDRQTVISKNSIQIKTYNEYVNSDKLIQMNHINVSRFNLFETPMKDNNQVKRVVLFSDTPLEEQAYSSQQLMVKICDSQWTMVPFDITKLQGNSICIRDETRENQNQSMFEIVVQVQYLPYPFSFSKMITFMPKYVFINKTCLTLYIIQSECEEKGLFKVFPLETSIFHWTDSSKEFEVSVRLEGFEFSGNFKIDTIGEMVLRLRSSFDHESLILNVSINEENNSFYIVVGDMSYAPPYRIENLTKTTFKICQKDCRSDDFDILKPFHITPFAWSYPMKEKLLNISICTQSQDVYLGPHNIDAIRKDEKSSILRDKKNGKEYILEIINEKTLKVVRILYSSNAISQQELIKVKQEQVKDENSTRIKIKLQELGMSIVSSQAREIAYVHLTDFKFSNMSTHKNRKISLKIGNIQIDNQLVRQNDAIILKRQQGDEGKAFVQLKIHYVNNEAIENLIYYKYFILEFAPFDLNLDGNFCDEFYKYALDVLQSTKRIAGQNSIDAMNIYDEADGGIDNLKQTFDELKKPYDKRDGIIVQKKLLFEHFYIHEIKFNFTFSSSPILFREFTMNPTLKFFIVLLSNLKNVNLKFATYQLQRQQLPFSIFIAQLKRNYIKQCYSHQQFLKIVASMGIFGNVGTSVNNVSNAFRQMINDRNVQGVKRVMKEVVRAGTRSVGGILESLQSGMHYIAQNNYIDEANANDDKNMSSNERDLFEDDIASAGRGDLSNLSSPLMIADTQNKIWFKIISREKKNYEEKKRLLKKQKFDEDKPIVQVKEGNLNEFFRRNQRQSQNTSLTHAFSTILNGPRTIMRGIWKFNEELFVNDDQNIGKVKKVRPPRFVSFRMELEPYNKEKARALQTLNDINLNVFVTETIERVFVFQMNTLILTGKRIIFVETEASRDSKSPSKANTESFKSWNILYSDIMKAQVVVYDTVKKAQIGMDELGQIIDFNGDTENLVFKLNILYEGDKDEDERATVGQSHPSLYFGGIEGKMDGLIMGKKKIKAKFSEQKKLHMFVGELEKRIKLKMIR